tara:strand:+ start:245 stop:505 length:261 start_codon:yes stop_codon:yes gene_type:complete
MNWGRVSRPNKGEAKQDESELDSCPATPICGAEVYRQNEPQLGGPHLLLRKFSFWQKGSFDLDGLRDFVIIKNSCSTNTVPIVAEK